MRSACCRAGGSTSASSAPPRSTVYGNLNSTAIGPYARPQVRLPGSGGANDIASMAGRFVVICRLGKRRFVETLNYLTTPGFLTGPGARERAGLPGSGPARVITDLAVLGFDPETRRMRVEELFPGVTMEQVQDNCGFRLDAAESPCPSPSLRRRINCTCCAT